jgi:alkanesulfonate monooxygenase SsuD/methylene tetrahydromethanopterin reductase-like flavin-dependent oxidoreductase (luciferase family)
MWSAGSAPFWHDGDHYHVDGLLNIPPPVQHRTSCIHSIPISA